MDAFTYRDGELYAEDVPVGQIAARYGTPAYVYSRAALESAFLAYRQALTGQDHLICYAVKANSNIAVLNLLSRLGAGFDIVSGGELARVVAAGGDPGKTVFSGVGKTAAEMADALELGIRCFNVESEQELLLLQDVAEAMGCTAPVSIRVNPDVDARTHPYISTGLRENKFGIDIAQAPDIYRLASRLPALRVVGIDCHIGSQLTDTRPFLDALDRVLLVVDQLQDEGIAIHHLDIGGGLGVRYLDEEPPSPGDYLAAILPKLAGRAVQLVLEPGRSIAANSGILVTRVEYLKANVARQFAIVDAAMNDLLRPALYQSRMAIIPVRPRQDLAPCRYDVVGPVCETGDFLGRDVELAITGGDLLVIRGAGAYGFTMSSNYNSRTRAPEIIVDQDRCHLVRARENPSDLMRGETLLP